MKQNAINLLLKELNTSPYKGKLMNWHIPALWNGYNYENAHKTFYDEVIVNPIDLLIHTIESIQKEAKSIYSKKDEKWIEKATVYSIHLRTLSAYDSDNDGYIRKVNSHGLNECGTFIKAILLLPHLKYIGIDTLYFLPLFKHSIQNKKGDLGSSYSITNYFELDPDLYDPLVPNLNLLQQAQAFFACTKLLGFKTVMDIIPRTCALDADLIQTHPDWFYWIKADAPFKLVNTTLFEPSSSATPERMEIVYQEEKGIQEYIDQFSLDPKTLNKHIYQQCIHESDGTVSSFLDNVKKYFNIQVAPAFSDCLNDPQPPWSDITYLRLYLDLPQLAAKYYPSEVPYIFYDSAKASLNPGKIANQPLWDHLSNIIPYWQDKLGIDGLRIDMGHALPNELIKLIKDKAMAKNESTVFIAEELNNDNHIQCKLAGYDVMSGNGFGECYHVFDGKAQTFYYNAKNLDLPIFALAESHDSPRLVQRYGGKELSRMVTCMSLFTPNGIPFINDGQECYEIQPLNIGLDATPIHQFGFTKSDPRYGKLGLFDATWMDWKDTNLIHDLHALAPIRHLILEAIFNPQLNTPLYFEHPNIYAYGASFKINNLENEHIVALANCNESECDLFVSLQPLMDQTNSSLKSIECIYSTDSNAQIIYQNNTNFGIHSKGFTFLLYKIELN